MQKHNEEFILTCMRKFFAVLIDGRIDITHLFLKHKLVINFLYKQYKEPKRIVE